MAPKKIKTGQARNSGQVERVQPMWTSCSGLPKWKQSPVEIVRNSARECRLPPLFLTGYWLKAGTATMTNTGYTVLIELANRKLPSMKGGPLGDDYEFMNVQFHWGPTNVYGSEHTINNRWYSMEAQVMHWNTRYGSVEKCYEKPDGIAIISFLFQVVGCPGMRDNPSVAPITDFLPRVTVPGNTVELAPGDCLWWMLECCGIPCYYTYAGSITTPPYSECVTWIILPEPIKISFNQADAFRTLHNYRLENIVKNYRSPQPLHKRKVYYATFYDVP